jgi:hypothetical protein
MLPVCGVAANGEAGGHAGRVRRKRELCELQYTRGKVR